MKSNIFLLPEPFLYKTISIYSQIFVYLKAVHQVNVHTIICNSCVCQKVSNKNEELHNKY